MTSVRESEHLFSVPFPVIEAATENFKNIIGKGGYGVVYKGQLTLSRILTTVAVKRLDTKISGQGLKEFSTEIQFLSLFKHPNIVSLVGFCNQGPEKILIYEYAHRGSLDKYLRTNEDPTVTCQLTWKQRLNICVDVARGLDHLHNHVAEHERVIHRDVKSANVLLDNNWKAMISDFGLSKIGRANEKDTFIFTNVVGTGGYVDPAYHNSRILTKESDVYSFGVVLFEVLCGRSCFYMDIVSKRRLLPELARYLYRDETLNQIIDPILSEYMNTNSMKKFSRIAYQCLLEDRLGRPSMDVVLLQLEKALELQEDADKARLSLRDRKIKEKLDSHVAYTTRNRAGPNIFDAVCKMLLYDGDQGSVLEIQSEVTLSRGNWTPICLPESWDQDAPESNRAELTALSNLVATGALHSTGAQENIILDNMQLTINILLRKKSDYNDLLVQSFSYIKKSLDNNGSRFGDSYIKHWVAIVELYKEVTRCAEDASGRLVYESLACIRSIISSVAQGLKASMAIKHDEVVTNTLREILDDAKALRVINDMLSCLVTCGTSLMSGSSNFLRAACEACVAIWSLIDAFEIQSTRENAYVFPLSSTYSHSLDQINIKGDECGPLMGKDYEIIVEAVTEAFLKSEAIRVSIFYCLRQRLEASWSSVIQEYYEQKLGLDIIQQLKAFLKEDPELHSLLVDMLFDKDDFTCRNAALAISAISSQSEYIHEDLRRCIHQLAKLLLSAESENITKINVACCLYSFSNHSDTLSEDMISQGAMEALLKVVADYYVAALDPNMIDGDQNALLNYTLLALHGMCKHQPSRQFIRSSHVYPTIGELRESPIKDIASHSTLVFNKASKET